MKKHHIEVCLLLNNTSTAVLGRKTYQGQRNMKILLDNHENSNQPESVRGKHCHQPVGIHKFQTANNNYKALYLRDLVILDSRYLQD